MLRLRWLGLQVTSLERAEQFYADELDLRRVDSSSTERRYAVGDMELRLKVPGAEPPGGTHVHYAFSTPSERYDDWLERLSRTHEIEEHDFGVYRSLYCFDPDDHCVEIGGRNGDGDGLTGIFEVVLEVASLSPAEQFYRSLGTEVLDRGDRRRRVRLDAGSFELELWEPQRGLAGARGGEHVDLGLAVTDVNGTIDDLAPYAERVDVGSTGSRVIDSDGHVLTLVPANAD